MIVYNKDIFREHIRLHLQLNHLIATGEGDSEAADCVRDNLDICERRLSEAELRLLRDISGDIVSSFESAAA